MKPSEISSTLAFLIISAIIFVFAAGLALWVVDKPVVFGSLVLFASPPALFALSEFLEKRGL
jgi:hypothetical protein